MVHDNATDLCTMVGVLENNRRANMQHKVHWSRGAPIMLWPIIGRLIIGAK